MSCVQIARQSLAQRGFFCLDLQSKEARNKTIALMSGWHYGDSWTLFHKVEMNCTWKEVQPNGFGPQKPKEMLDDNSCQNSARCLLDIVFVFLCYFRLSSIHYCPLGLWRVIRLLLLFAVVVLYQLLALACMSPVMCDALFVIQTMTWQAKRWNLQWVRLPDRVWSFSADEYRFGSVWIQTHTHPTFFFRGTEDISTRTWWM